MNKWLLRDVNYVTSGSKSSLFSSGEIISLATSSVEWVSVSISILAAFSVPELILKWDPLTSKSWAVVACCCSGCNNWLCSGLGSQIIFVDLDSNSFPDASVLFAESSIIRWNI